MEKHNIIEEHPVVVLAYKTSVGLFVSEDLAQINRRKITEGDGWREGSGQKVREGIELTQLLRIKDENGNFRYFTLGEVFPM